jgi:hypothetical protein
MNWREARMRRYRNAIADSGLSLFLTASSLFTSKFLPLADNPPFHRDRFLTRIQKDWNCFCFQKTLYKGGRHFPCNEADDKQLGGIDYDTESYFHHRIRFSGGIVSV